ncbi:MULTISPECIES: K(+)-transporting ATPase subunit C [Sphingobacterium]|uniref:K(+)-transporting ATPase subunit C n=1 Tax=Sphingobacterium TaxID=28453 RepID=UPI000E952083|nr:MULTISPECIES: K(+)-transporting ATPase subunit C [Sphingobacterium]HAF35238.1 potassium-transporting ATPase subunit C [Sphingobacterium sp.]HBI89082.1 potassium-transporting ATPase subunit C [Sphingobacterium sp.]
MKKHILPAIKLTIVMIIFFTIIYPLAVWGIAQMSPNSGKGEITEYNGKKYYANIGQTFNADEYFWSRPSAVDYNASGSGGSNKGSSNEEYLNLVQARIDTFLVHNPGISKSEIPVDLVTASGSGLDPNISVQSAKIQTKRIAVVRGFGEQKINQLIEENIEDPLWGIFGPQKVNVLKLNIALDKLDR